MKLPLPLLRRCLAIFLTGPLVLAMSVPSRAAVISQSPLSSPRAVSTPLFTDQAIVMTSWISWMWRLNRPIIVLGSRLRHSLDNVRQRRIQREQAEDLAVEFRGRREFLKLGALAAGVAAAVPVTNALETVVESWLNPLTAHAAGFDSTAINAWLDHQQLGVDPYTKSPSPLLASYQVDPTNPLNSQAPSDVLTFLSGYANTYDNCVYGISYLKSGRPDAFTRVRAMLAYYQQEGVPFRSNKEPYVFTGEAMWAGLLALHYTRLTGDDQFEPLLRNLDAYISDPRMNLNGAVMGTPGQMWASTEHNLDVLAYAQMRYHFLLERNLPGDPANSLPSDLDRAKNVRALQTRVAGWVANNAYIPPSAPYDPARPWTDSNSGFFLRGDNDAHFASDTHFWGIDVLTDIKNADPDFYTASGLSQINLPVLMRVAELRTRAVNYPYTKPDGTMVNLIGFRFESRPAGATPSPVTFEWTGMAARAYLQLGETVHANQILYGISDTAALATDPAFAGVSLTGLPPFLNGLQDVLATDAKGRQSMAYAGEVGLAYLDNPSMLATSNPAIASVVWSATGLAGLPGNVPFSFGQTVPAVPTLSNPPAPANAVPIVGVSNNSGPDWTAADGNSTFDLSTFQTLHLTFPPSMAGKIFYLRLLPQGGSVDPSLADWVSTIPYQIPFNGVLDIPLSDFTDGPLMNGQRLSPSQLQKITRISLHSGAAPFGGRYAISGQSAADVVAFTRIQGIPAPLTARDGERVVSGRPGYIGLDSVSAVGAPILDLSDLTSIRIKFVSGTEGKLFYVRLLPAGMDPGDPAWLNLKPYSVPADGSDLVISLDDFTGGPNASPDARLVNGQHLTPDQLKTIAGISLHSGPGPWGYGLPGNTFNDLVMFSELDGVLGTQQTAVPSAAFQSAAAAPPQALRYRQEKSVLDRLHLRPWPLDLRSLAPHSAIPAGGHLPFLEQNRAKGAWLRRAS